MRAWLTCAIGLIALAPAAFAAPERLLLDRPRIIVNNKVLTEHEVAGLRELQQKELQSRLKGPELERALEKADQDLTKQLVENLLLEIHAEELGIVVGDKEIDQRVEAITRRDPNVSEIYSEAQLKDMVYKDALRRQVMQREVGTRVRVSDEDIKAACLKSAGDNREVEVGHILVRGSDAAALDKILAIRKTLEAGADFERTATARSEDPTASLNHGKLGFISRGQFVKEFEDRAFSLKVGELSEPVRTQFGYHLIRVFAERNKAQVNCDALDENGRQRFYGEIFAQRSEQRMAEFLEQMKKKADIRIVDR